MGHHRTPPVTAVLGPTNTGKTHLAVERMLGHSSGMIGFPLRLLAREVYDRTVAAKGADQVALITGEEKSSRPARGIFSARPSPCHWSAMWRFWRSMRHRWVRMKSAAISSPIVCCARAGAMKPWCWVRPASRRLSGPCCRMPTSSADRVSRP
nr:hypothetical protein [Hankyongella ginsenosidimutans]